jgi:hypothetical protein
LTCDKNNYKIPEWLKPEEVTLEIAERLNKEIKMFSKMEHIVQ